MATYFYCFETTPNDLPKGAVIVLPKQIGEEPQFTTDEETGEQVPLLDEEGNQVIEPIFESVVHINTMKPVEGWEANICNPITPRMIFG